MTHDPLLGADTFLVHIDDSNLAEEAARSRAFAQSLGLVGCCRKMAGFGLNQQQAWQWTRQHFPDVSFRTFKSAFDSVAVSDSDA